MRKYIAVLFLAASILACGQWQSPRQVATQTAAAATAAADAATATAASWTKTPTPTEVPTATPDFKADLPYFFADVYQGPSLDYPMLGKTVNAVTIYGQAYACVWFKVLANVDGSLKYGWVEADKLTYTVKCSDVENAEIPPLPTNTPATISTRTPSPQPLATHAPAATIPPSHSCQTASIEIENDTTGTAAISLAGPATYDFDLAPGGNTLTVCAGTYRYTVWDCGTTNFGTLDTGNSYVLTCHG